MAEEIIMTSLPSVIQENNQSGDALTPKERRTEIKSCFERSLVWEAAEDFECLQPEVIDTKIVGRRKVTLPNASLTTKTRRLKREHYSHNVLSSDDLKLPKQNMNRSGLLKSSSEPPNRNTHHVSRSEMMSVAMPFVSPRSRSFTEPLLGESKDAVEGKSFRENLSLIYRQNKEMKKLEYDNMASRQALQNAQDLISDLKAKIEKRNKYIRERNEKEGDLARDVETLRRERDEKLLEYKLIMKTMNQALTGKDKALDDIETERKRMEGVYQDHLKTNTDLMRKIEAREKQITQLKEKTEKAMKWKTNVRT